MRITFPASTFALLTLSAVASAAPQDGVLGYYREPALHGDTLVFAAEGDLWTVSHEGGLARRLTSHLAEETNPTISPNGKTLAFTARYEGPSEVYTMPLSGGLPTRRTFEAETSMARAWTPDGKLVYETSRYSGLPRPGLVALDLESLTAEPLPLDYCSDPDFDESGETVFFVRPPWHRNVTKRYTGGTARDIWRFTDGGDEAVALTGDYGGESHSPMWWAGRVYFVTDRDGTMNIWSMEGDGKDLQQHTRHSAFDVRTPSLHGGRIAYQRAADLWVMDIASGETTKLDVTLASDLDQLREKWVDNPMGSLTSARLHPEGESVVLTSRGRVFVAPAKGGRLTRASTKDGVRFRDVTFMPDGKTLVGFSDESGELELVRLPANGVGEDELLTSDGTILRFDPTPSPDGSHVAFSDKNNDLFVVELETGKSTKINQNREGVSDLTWSPDGRWLAYSMTAENTHQRIVVYSMGDGATLPVTSDRVNSFSPAWDPQGEFLYFLSERHLESLVSGPWGQRQPEPYFDRMVEVYQVALRPGLRSPFRPADELYRPADSKEVRDQGKDSGDGEPDGGDSSSESSSESSSGSSEAVEITAAGLELRLERVPVAPGNYRSLVVNQDALFMRSVESGPDPGAHLVAVKIKMQGSEGGADVETLMEDVRSHELSSNGKKLLVRKGSSFYVVPAKASKVKELKDQAVDLGEWSYSLDVREDWRQIFVDAWRLERDYFYDPGMHGVDWEATKERYLPLVKRVTTRAELSHLIGCMMGELSALHMSVRGGDLRAGSERVPVASLGARLRRDQAAGGYLIERIFRSDPNYPAERPPLADPYLDVHAGDVIERVNGTSVLDVPDIGVLLRRMVDRQVLLTVRSGGGGLTPRGESRDVVVVPVGSESDLRYSDWEVTRREQVDQGSEEQVGYVHLRAMGGSNITEWYRQFYPVFQRKALIIDVRNNRGGNIDSFLLSRLLRKDWMYWSDRAGNPSWNMHYAFRGHMVVLVNEMTASDGEAFADGFRRLGLGKVFGMRTWGGEIWLSSGNRLSDGGLARAPMFGVYGPEGEWLVEQVGVIPDVEIDNPPHATFLGADAQLDAAIQYLLEEIKKDPRPVPAPPEYPDRSFEYPKEGR
ncbi:MAG: tricorn protease [Planctomycetota bacterium]|jgi:tricorn protease